MPTAIYAAASGWLLPLDFGVVPCSKCHSRDFIGQYRKRPVYHLNRSLGGRRLVRLPGMAASNVCERVLSTRSRRWAQLPGTVTDSQPGLLAVRNVPLESPIPACWQAIVCRLETCGFSRPRLQAASRRNQCPEYPTGPAGCITLYPPPDTELRKNQ